MSKIGSKIIQGLQDAVKGAKCNHIFLFLRQNVAGGGVTGRCPKCRMTYTSWPGGPHYEEIMAARTNDRREDFIVAVTALQRIVASDTRGSMKSLAINALEQMGMQTEKAGQ